MPTLLDSRRAVWLMFPWGLCLLSAWGAAAISSLADEVTSVPAVEHRTGNAQSVAFSRDGRLVAAGFGGPATRRIPVRADGGMIVIWETATGDVVRTSREYGDIINLRFSHDGKAWLHSRVYTPGDSVDDNVSCITSISDGSLIRRWSGHDSHVAASSPTGGQIAIAQGRDICRIFDASRPDQPPADARSLSVADSYTGRCLAFSPRGELLVAVHGVLEPIVRDDGKPARGRAIRTKGLTIFNATSWTVRTSTVSDELLACTALDVSRAGRWIATGHARGIVRVWDGQTLQLSQQLNLDTETAVLPRFSPDGRTLAVLTQPANSPVWRYADTPSGFEFGRRQVGTTCELVLYDTAGYGVRRHFRFQDGTFRTYHANRPQESLNPSRLAFSPDGRQILVGCNGVILLDTDTGRIVRQYGLPNAAP